MKNKIYSFFLNEKIINAAIILNITAIVLEEYYVFHPIISIVGYATIFFFIGEMICKQAKNGILTYWKDWWNVLDGSLVIISLPTLVNLFFPQFFTNSSVLLVLRIFRIFRFFRLTHFFPNFETIILNFRKALRDSQSILIGYCVALVICGLISCALFGKAAPQYFGTPGNSIYTTFRLFTIEGWYEIPDAVTAQMSTTMSIMVRIYFGMTLLSGGIIGLSLLNSIFVDAMVSDNNDEVLDEIKKLQKQVEELKKEVKDKNKNL